MKSILIMLLFTITSFSQKQVYNVQRYCVDEAPFRVGECDLSGNEYSFVFVDAKANQVVLFLSNVRMEFKIVGTPIAKSSGEKVYTLQNTNGSGKLSVHENKMAFALSDRNIALTVGKSTKS